eukprot:4107319-Lingulodinium_polyedra.AAC.1
MVQRGPGTGTECGQTQETIRLWTDISRQRRMPPNPQSHNRLPQRKSGAWSMSGTRRGGRNLPDA